MELVAGSNKEICRINTNKPNKKMRKKKACREEGTRIKNKKCFFFFFKESKPLGQNPKAIIHLTWENVEKKSQWGKSWRFCASKKGKRQKLEGRKRKRPKPKTGKRCYKSKILRGSRSHHQVFHFNLVPSRGAWFMPQKWI